MEKYIQYEKAQGLMDAGEYENALAIYKQLGKFENAQALKKTAETEIKNKNPQ